MKKIKVLSIFLLVAMMATVLVGCSNDDDDTPVNLKSYAIGTWHSYKAIMYYLDGEYAGESQEVTISKTGEYSDAYWELKLYQNGNGTFSYLKKDGEGIKHWVDAAISYSVKGDVVTVHDSDASLDFIFNPGDKTMSFQISKTIDGVTAKMIVYFKK
ncbi:MAG: hypothetical protein J5678_00920 [Bacteroidaceae bacterium]|nr:hypothetical protein [Bacteroidaceae bacterium]